MPTPKSLGRLTNVLKARGFCPLATLVLCEGFLTGARGYETSCRRWVVKTMLMMKDDV
jgi:hypothetical protein